MEFLGLGFSSHQSPLHIDGKRVLRGGKRGTVMGKGFLDGYFDNSLDDSHIPI